MAKGIRVADRRDVVNAKPQDLSYSSDTQSPKVAKILKGQFTTDANGLAKVVIPNDLHYSPMVMGFYKGPDRRYPNYTDRWRAFDNNHIAILTDRSKITILTDQFLYAPGEYNMTPNATYYYKVWVFKDPVSTDV